MVPAAEKNMGNEQEELACSYRWTGWVWKKNLLKLKTFRKITDPFRGLCRIYLKLMQENWKITTRDCLALETSLGSWPIMQAQKPLWTLDARHVDNLNEGKLLYWINFDRINWDLTGITSGSYSVWKLSVELHSKLIATLFMVFGVTL